MSFRGRGLDGSEADSHRPRVLVSNQTRAVIHAYSRFYRQPMEYISDEHGYVEPARRLLPRDDSSNQR